MELIGYARTYTTDEDSDILIASLKAASSLAAQHYLLRGKMNKQLLKNA